MLGSDISSEEGEDVQITTEVVWINSLSKEIYETYVKLLDIKHKDTPLELKPNPTGKKDLAVWFQAFEIVKLKDLTEKEYNKLLDHKFKGQENMKPNDTDPKDPELWAEAQELAKLPNKCRIIGVSRTWDPRIDSYPCNAHDKPYLPVLNKEVEQTVAKLTEESQQIKNICKETQERMVEQTNCMFRQMSEDRARYKNERNQDRLQFQQQLIQQQAKSTMLFKGVVSLVPGEKDALPPQFKEVIGCEDGSNQHVSKQIPSQVFPSGTQLTQNFPLSLCQDSVLSLCLHLVQVHN